jgi:hypothetical protein
VQAKLVAGFAGAAFLLTPLVQAANKPRKPTQTDSDMARAIAFQRQKDAADARQARLEARHPTISDPNSAERTADRDVSGQRGPDPGEGLHQSGKQPDHSTPPPK